VQRLVLIVAAVLGTLALYEIARRVGVLRFVLGMKAKRRVPKAVVDVN
jgi:hypothetical protein